MKPIIGVLNAGSSSLKTALFEQQGTTLSLFHRATIDYRDSTPEAVIPATIQQLQQQFPDCSWVAVGHRVVHGGVRYHQPIRIDAEVIAELEKAIPLAPLHQPYSLLGIRLLQEQFPHIPHVACFDTAFHRTMPEVAQRIALPKRFVDAGIRRYGFHGLSYESIAQQMREIDPIAADGKVIVAHLGQGASLCAMIHGQSQATTMGFTPSEGVIMGTRIGSIDPGLAIHLLQQHHLSTEGLDKLFNHESGLLGVSGIASDMRTLLASDAPAAKEAIALFVYRIQQAIGALAASIGGIDTLIFTGGIGEHATEIRAQIGETCRWLGLEIDPIANRQNASVISTAHSRVTVRVLPTNEEGIIAQHCQALLFPERNKP